MRTEQSPFTSCPTDLVVLAARIFMPVSWAMTEPSVQRSRCPSSTAAPANYSPLPGGTAWHCSFPRIARAPSVARICGSRHGRALPIPGQPQRTWGHWSTAGRTNWAEAFRLAEPVSSFIRTVRWGKEESTCTRSRGISSRARTSSVAARKESPGRPSPPGGSPASARRSVVVGLLPGGQVKGFSQLRENFRPALRRQLGSAGIGQVEDVEGHGLFRGQFGENNIQPQTGQAARDRVSKAEPILGANFQHRARLRDLIVQAELRRF